MTEEVDEAVRHALEARLFESMVGHAVREYAIDHAFAQSAARTALELADIFMTEKEAWEKG